MRLCSYIVVNDAGFVPNPFWDYCTCAACTPNHQGRRLKRGDWLVGHSSADIAGQRTLIYAMRISESPLNFDKYYRDPRFARKKARDGSWKDRCGDNIYFRDDNRHWNQALAFHHRTPENIAQDTRRPRVFISDYFFYFGEEAPVIPENFTSLLRTGKWPQGCGPYHEGKLVDEFVQWLEGKYPAGQYDRRQYVGLPRDREEEAGPPGGPGCPSTATGITSECSKPRADDARPHAADRKRS